MAIAKTVRFRVRKDQVQAVERIVARFVKSIREEEPGTILYDSFQDVADETWFTHTMAFVDDAAQAAHQKSDHCAKFVATLYPLCQVEPKFSDVYLVATRNPAKKPGEA